MRSHTQISPLAVLRTYFGYDSFRGHQEEIIQHLMTGGDALVLMPTGGGKSICYQIPAVIRNGVGIVISPLIALMQDQVDAVRQLGIRAEFLNSTLSPREARTVELKMVSGEIDLMYVAPERLLTTDFQQLLKKTQLALFAIDEAHCVSQWGHDFRPEYLQLSILSDRFPHIPRIALTATADLATRREIIEKLKLEDARQFISSFDRPNIYYRVELKDNEKAQLLEFIQTEHPGDSGIVYCLSRKRVEATAKWLSEKGLTALPYHAGMEQGLRLMHQRRFLQEERVIMVATIAFGMGIDKPDVRFVAHLDLPKTLESYYQETGRAGRDGERADAWMVYSLADVVALRQILDVSEGNEQFKRIQQQKMQAMLGFCETARCRRQVLLGYFGEDLSKSCGFCDTCNGKMETWDGTVVAQKALSCIYRTGQRFGAAYLTDVLLGKEDERILRYGHDRISTFGVGKELSESEWKSVFRQLVAAGLLSVDIEGKGGFSLAPSSRPVLRGEQRFELRKDPVPAKKRRSSIRELERASVASDTTSGGLWEKLRVLRLKIAREQSIAPFMVFHDSTLKEMVRYLPCTPEEMRKISGVGERKLKFYGDQFLAAIRSYLEGNPLPEEEVRFDSPESDERSRGKYEVSSTSTHLSTKEQKAEVIRLLKEGKLNSGEIAERVGVSPPTVWAYKAHLTMGTYGADGERGINRDADPVLPDTTGTNRSDDPLGCFHEDELSLVRLKELIINRPLKRPDHSITDKRLLELRKKYRRAYEPWSDEEDEWLVSSYGRKQNTAALAEALQRHPGAIMSRIRKLTGK
ncbi:MAG: DNA helicase RecQ [Deltaproteobacteria bacterium]|nr:DNA helicase RecQ [Deltaproteobacteria bacterium]